MLDDARYTQLADRKVSHYSQAKSTVVATDELDALDMDAALRRKLGKHLPALHNR